LQHHVLPWKLFRAMEKEDTKKENGGSKQQLMLDHIMVKEKKSEFSCADLLHEVAKFVTCDDQVFVVTDKASFRNCLVAMRPWTTKADLPSSHNVKIYLHKQFITCLEELKRSIAVGFSVTQARVNAE
ncbi:hypothetical protein DFH94DRAFT_630161, partial [Russula ochroleuca]